MVIFELLSAVGTSILIGYLSFSNYLAAHIESFLHIPPYESTLYTHSENQKSLNEPIPREGTQDSLISTIASTSYVGIPKILLENQRFQRAALIASGRNENAGTIPSDTPIENVIADALVNVFCQYKTDTYIRTTTGTGFFINPKGVILTNAHVAQFLLLEEDEDGSHDVQCVIRSGSPASPRYKAELLYISPTWILQNASLITDESPTGTGERDYALLYVSKTLDNTPLPAQFPIIPTDTALLARSVENTTVMTAGYPAGALIRNGADTELRPVIADTTIGSLYTFGSNYADLFSISESTVGEHGASGGPIVHTTQRNAIGLIVTKGDAPTEGERSLRAITLSYIDRTIVEETGFTLAENMFGDVAYRGQIFKSIMVPFLADLLKDELDSTNSMR